MTFLFICPCCQTRTEVPDEFAGQTGPCAVCGKTVTVPRNPVRSDGTSAKTSRSSAVLVVLLVAGGLLFSFALIGIIVAVLFPAFNTVQVSSRQSQCGTNLQAIASAMLQYHDQNGSFPPAYVADENGKPMHSWRVLLLPYLGYGGLYTEYDMNSPFDSDANIELLSRMPPEYGCPTDPDSTILSETNYMVVVGDNTMFPGTKTTSVADVADGLSLTIMLVEVQQTGVSWMDPVDLNYDNMVLEINANGTTEISSHHDNGAHVATGDGVAHFLVDTTPPHYVNAMLTISGGESIPATAFDPQ